MKTEFDAASFRQALTHVMPAVRKATTLPILTHIRVRLGGIDASNNSMQITAPVDGKGDPINVCVPADRIKAAASVAGEKIVFHQEREGLYVIKAGKHRFTTPTLPGQDFPIIDEVEPQATFQSSTLGAAIGRVAFASAKSDIRPYFNGVTVECENGTIEATAMSSGMLATVAAGHHHQPFQAIIPNEAVEVLVKVGDATWMISRSMVVVETDDARIVAKTVDATPPGWRRLMTSTQSSVTIPRQELVTANANSDLIEHAYRMGYLYGEKEYTFLKQTMRKRNLSAAQIAWKVKINRRIVGQTVVRKRTAR